MRRPSSKEKKPRIYEDQCTQTSTDEDGWLVCCLVFSLRLFLVFVVALARAVVILAGDKIPDSLFDQAIPAAVVSSLNPLEFPQSTSASDSEVPQASPPQSYYIVFTGREVGYTTSSTLMTSLVQGVPNNHSRKFSTLDKAIHAYTEAVQHGNVRRVRTAIQPSGHVEFIYEYMGMNAGIRNLDEPRLSPQLLTPANLPSVHLPPTPATSETLSDIPDGAVNTSVSSSAPVGEGESNGLVMPVGWTMVNNLDTGADTVIISTAPVISTSASAPAGTPSSFTVIFLDSDEDTTDSSILANNSAASVHSARSSDVYYTDKRYDIAFASYIEEEDSNAVGVEAAPST